MNDFERCNKLTGIHWLKQPLKDVKIKIKIEPKESVFTLPKYEDYLKDSNTVDVAKLDINNVEEYIFKWQEKVFSTWEMNIYSEIHNCMSDIEHVYHNMMTESEYKPQKVFTYINEDYHLPLPSNGKETYSNDTFCNLSTCFDKLNLNERIGRIFEDDSSSAQHLFRSEENIALQNEQWTAMHIAFDNSTYDDNSQVLIKQESILLSLYYNITNNYLLISPDVNDLILNPYSIDVDSGPLGYQYSIELPFEELESDEELVTLLNKLYKKWEKKHKELINFDTPPLGKKKTYVTLEILSASRFELDNLYIEYDIKIPQDVKCCDTLHGRTHISKSLTIDDELQWNYGHIFDLDLEVPADIDPSPLQIYFEAISIDWWGRHRTEGYGYLPISLNPGQFDERLLCCRPEEMDKVEANNRRFFVGGCHLIKDLEILSEPQLHNAKFSYAASGALKIRWSTVRQNHIPGIYSQPSYSGCGSASALLQGADAVLRKYSQAKARLAAATKGLTEEDEINE